MFTRLIQLIKTLATVWYWCGWLVTLRGLLHMDFLNALKAKVEELVALNDVKQSAKGELEASVAVSDDAANALTAAQATEALKQSAYDSADADFDAKLQELEDLAESGKAD